MKRYLILVSTLMITAPMIAMEEREPQQEKQSTQPQQELEPSSQNRDRENIFQKALESCCDSSCCAAIKYPLLTIIYAPVFIMNNIRYPNGGRN